jgi:hypothetical protein
MKLISLRQALSRALEVMISLMYPYTSILKRFFGDTAGFLPMWEYA